MRPEWLECEACLWVDGGCEKSIDLSVCSDWTCARCWEEWDIKEYEDGPLAEEFWFVDHSCCAPARVGRGEVPKP